MILTCEKCNTGFKVDATKLGPNGRKVKCASCGHIWLAKATQEEPAKPIPEAKPDAKAEAKTSAKSEAQAKKESPKIVAPKKEILQSEQKPSRFKSVSFLKIAASLLIIFNFLAFILFNKEVVGQTDFYDMVGQYDTRALEIDSHDILNTKPPKGTNIQIAWAVKNTSTRMMQMPRARFKLYDKDMNIVGEKINDSSKNIQPGGILRFNDQLIHNSKPSRYFTVEIGNPTELATR